MGLIYVLLVWQAALLNEEYIRGIINMLKRLKYLPINDLGMIYSALRSEC